MYRINEIFSSYQGEGPYMGKHALFVRFSGCNLHCPFCDTEHERVTEWHDSDESLINRICSMVDPSIKHIVLTGGEPMLQIKDKFLHYLATTLIKKTPLNHKLLLNHYPIITVETNGTIPPPEATDTIRASVGYIVSPKFTDVSVAPLMTGVFNRNNCAAVKLIAPKSRMSAKRTADLVHIWSSCVKYICGFVPIYIQPMYPKKFGEASMIKAVKSAVFFQKQLMEKLPEADIRLGIQAHKHWGIQ
ncbi:MAG: hypothetical protein Pg6A_19780 [Termitinemataceae bacterium]|nr:MAG: hypothetical protein Pg6A_19780 [Termitinemataceae bacterium]